MFLFAQVKFWVRWRFQHPRNQNHILSHRLQDRTNSGGQSRLHLPLHPPPHATQHQGRSEQALYLHPTARQVRAGCNPLHPTLPSPHDIKVGQSRLQPPPPNPPLSTGHQGRSEQAPTASTQPYPLHSESGREK